jgi:hypothetical protein
MTKPDKELYGIKARRGNEIFGARRATRAENMKQVAGESAGSFEIHSEARGPHWVAWLSRPGDKGPHQSILLVGATREEAETKARVYATRIASSS